MKLADNIYVLELPTIQGSGQTFIYPTLINDEEHGLILVDTGYPGQFDILVKAINEEGFAIKDLRYIILTHQDIDHVGNVGNIIKEVPDLQVICYKDEEKYINGTQTPTKIAALEKQLTHLPEQVKALYEGMKSFFENNKVGVDITVSDHDKLPCAPDIEVIFTPGHTPGHMCLYLAKYQLLIGGDIVNAKEGKFNKVAETFNANNGQYLESLNKLKGLDIKTVICYHGGVMSYK